MTPLQLRILDWTREFIAVSGLTPSVREIGEWFDMGPSNVQRALDALVEGGHLLREPGKVRSLRVPDQPDLRAVPTDVIAAELGRRGVTLAALDPKVERVHGQRVTCAADTCGGAVQRGQLFCRQHWFALPFALRDRITTAFARRDRARYQDAVAEARDLIDSCAWRKAS